MQQKPTRTPRRLSQCIDRRSDFAFARNDDHSPQILGLRTSWNFSQVRNACQLNSAMWRRVPWTGRSHHIRL